MLDKNSMAGTVLGALREARGVIQSVIANECGRSASYISQWENRHLDIPEWLIEVYSRKIDISEAHIWDLIDFWNKEKQKYAVSNGGVLTLYTFEERAFNHIKNNYHQEPLNPRTRRNLNPRR